MTKQEFLPILNTLSSTFSKSLDELAIEAYWVTLSALTQPEFRAAALKALQRKEPFMPTPGQLLDFAGKGDDTEARAAFAWEQVRGAIRKHDSYASVDFGPLVNAIVRNMGGWIRLCDMTRDEAPWKRKEFERVYAMFSRTPVDEYSGRHLTGEHPGKPVRVLCEAQPERKKLEAVG